MVNTITSSSAIPGCVKADNGFQMRLEAALEIAFCPLATGGDAPSSDTDGLLTSADVRSAVLAIERDGYALLPLRDERTALVLPVDGTALPALSVGIVTTSDRRLLRRLVRTTRQLTESESQINRQSFEMDSCLELLTDNMEQQTWLRTLSEQMRLCDLSTNVESVADELLTSLKGLIRAQSIALFRGEFDRPAADQPAAGRQSTALWIGPPVATNAVWSEWFGGSLIGEHAPRTHVSNRDRVDGRLKAHGVESLLAVPLLSSTRHRGWLVAVNRTPSGRSLSGFEQLSEAEFGTVEASITEAAATLLATHTHNVDLLDEQAALLVGVISSISSAIDARDPYTRGHSERVARHARRIARRLGRPEAECERFYLCGLLHDVGKIGVPDHVLKKPGRLTDEEFAEIKKHPEIGYRIVKNLTQLADLLPGILHHHESADGSGYPHGLSGDEIPFLARVIMVADAYDAMTSDRPYRKGMPHEKAAGILCEQSGVQWDARIVEAFLQTVPEDPSVHAEAAADIPTTFPADLMSRVDAEIRKSLAPSTGATAPVPSVAEMTAVAPLR